MIPEDLQNIARQMQELQPTQGWEALNNHYIMANGKGEIGAYATETGRGILVVDSDPENLARIYKNYHTLTPRPGMEPLQITKGEDIARLAYYRGLALALYPRWSGEQGEKVSFCTIEGPVTVDIHGIETNLWVGQEAGGPIVGILLQACRAAYHFLRYHHGATGEDADRMLVSAYKLLELAITIAEGREP